MSSDRYCSICAGPVQLLLRHCQRCETVQCSGDLCREIQDHVCGGRHVHEGCFCYLCRGDIYEMGCPGANFRVERDPRIVEVRHG